MDAFVLICDVEDAAFTGDVYSLDAREARELADELCFERTGVGVLRESAAEVGGYGLPAARIVLDEDALLVAAVDVAKFCPWCVSQDTTGS